MMKVRSPDQVGALVNYQDSLYCKLIKRYGLIYFFKAQLRD